MEMTSEPLDTDRLLDLATVRSRVPLGRTRFLEIVRTGELRTVTIGRRRFCRASDLDAWLAALTDGPAMEAPR